MALLALRNKEKPLGMVHKEGGGGKGGVVRKGGARDHRGTSHSRLTGVPLTVGSQGCLSQ